MECLGYDVDEAVEDVGLHEPRKPQKQRRTDVPQTGVVAVEEARDRFEHVKDTGGGRRGYPWITMNTCGVVRGDM